MQGPGSLDLGPGEYAVVASEWRREMDDVVDTLRSGTGEGDDALWHLNDVRAPDGRTVLEVVDDRRAMEGLSTSGHQFLLRTPDGDPVMAIQRSGGLPGRGATLRAAETGDALASWSQSIPIVGSWTLSDPEGARVATAKRSWSLRSLAYPVHHLKTANGEAFGEISVRQDGLFYAADVTLERAAVPPAVALAFGYGVAWATSDL